jgi:Transposase DDE domain
MRPVQYTVTPQDVEECATTILQEAIELPDRGRKCPASVIWHILLYAAARITSLCDACARLRDAPGDDAVRKALAKGLPAIDELENRLNKGLLDCLPPRLRRGARRRRLAADLTLIPYHGQPRHDRSEIYRGEAKSGTTHFHAYATCYLVYRGRRFTLALTPVLLGTPLHEVLRRLLARVRQAGLQPRVLLLDRGFYSVEVVRYLQAARVPFLMPAVLRGRKPGDPRGPTATNAFAARKRSEWSTYAWTNAAGKRASVSVCAVVTYRRRRHGKRHRTTLVYVFWGLRPPSFTWVRQTYRLRFGIESSYRQMNQARIRTCTRDPLLRLLFVGIALILRNVWVWLHLLVLSSPHRGGRLLRLEKLRFRTLLLWLIHLVESVLGVHDATQAHAPTEL